MKQLIFLNTKVGRPAAQGGNKQEETMELARELSRLADEFVMDIGTDVLQDIDTPSFVRKEYGVTLEDTGKSPSAGVVVEPDEKIIRFLSVIKRKDFALGMNAG
jgi:hypothetical protein